MVDLYIINKQIPVVQKTEPLKSLFLTMGVLHYSCTIASSYDINDFYFCSLLWNIFFHLSSMSKNCYSYEYWQVKRNRTFSMFRKPVLPASRLSAYGKGWRFCQQVQIITDLQKGGVPAAPSGTATLLRLSPNYQFYPRTLLAVTYFRYPRLSWLDGRCVQGPGTYSPRHGWCAITSESNFMESGYRLQSELRPAFEISIQSPGSGPLYRPL